MKPNSLQRLSAAWRYCNRCMMVSLYYHCKGLPRTAKKRVGYSLYIGALFVVGLYLVRLKSRENCKGFDRLILQTAIIILTVNLFNNNIVKVQKYFFLIFLVFSPGTSSLISSKSVHFELFIVEVQFSFYGKSQSPKLGVLGGGNDPLKCTSPYFFRIICTAKHV